MEEQVEQVPFKLKDILHFASKRFATDNSPDEKDPNVFLWVKKVKPNEITCRRFINTVSIRPTADGVIKYASILDRNLMQSQDIILTRHAPDTEPMGPGIWSARKALSNVWGAAVAVDFYKEGDVYLVL